MYKYHFILSHHSAKHIFSIFIIFSSFFCLGYHIAGSYSEHMEIKSPGMAIGFKSVSVKEHDTLWSIAKENYSKEFQGSLNDYIREIKRCNSLSSSYINAGSSLVVPIYMQNVCIQR